MLCNTCNEEKDQSEFSKGRKQCKSCKIIYNKKYYLENQEKLRQDTKKYRIENKEAVNAHQRVYNKQYRIENKEKIAEKDKKYQATDNGKKKGRERTAKYREVHKDRLAIERRADRKERYKTDPNYRIKHHCRNRLLDVLKGHAKKPAKTMEIMDCSIEQLKAWLEYNFDDNMNWDNMGPYWHIDHIKPCASFDFAKSKDDIYECFGWKNLRPCEGKENLSKGNKVDNELIEKYKNLALKFEKEYSKNNE